MRVTIQHRPPGEPIYTTDVPDDDRYPIRTAVERAYLAGADLAGADLAGANLRDAHLGSAYLERADLGHAYLAGADLVGADLAGASLASASLAGADLAGASLMGANLRGANLRSANLRGANLGNANLTAIRDDVHDVLATYPNEVAALLAALREGRIDGSVYEGECVCLVGTIANTRGCSYMTLAPDTSRPAERWFLAIRRGDTPTTSQIAAITDGWIVAWLEE
jgi:hypothetical protein